MRRLALRRGTPRDRGRHRAGAARRVWILCVAALALGASLGAGRVAAAPAAEGRCARDGGWEICITPQTPIQGRPCDLTIRADGQPAGGQLLVATYRPNSEVARCDTLGATNAAGTLAWSPRDAGMATLDVYDAGRAVQTMTVSIKFRETPALGVAILILAGIILFGGNGYALARTFGRKR